MIVSPQRMPFHMNHANNYQEPHKYSRGTKYPEYSEANCIESVRENHENYEQENSERYNISTERLVLEMIDKLLIDDVYPVNARQNRSVVQLDNFESESAVCPVFHDYLAWNNTFLNNITRFTDWRVENMCTADIPREYLTPNFKYLSTSDNQTLYPLFYLDDIFEPERWSFIFSPDLMPPVFGELPNEYELHYDETYEMTYNEFVSLLCPGVAIHQANMGYQQYYPQYYPQYYSQ